MLTPGQAYDVQGFALLFRMITDRIEAFLANRGYDADAIREEIEAAGVEAVIPAKANRRNPAPHDRTKYKRRNLIERLFNKLKNWHRIATRYDKTKESYLGFVRLASLPAAGRWHSIGSSSFFLSLLCSNLTVSHFFFVLVFAVALPASGNGSRHEGGLIHEAQNRVLSETVTLRPTPSVMIL